VAVEWWFGEVVRLWAFVDFKKNQRILIQPVGVYYKLACLLTNAHACLYGNELSLEFELEPPDLIDYFHIH
jgi:nuclease HARBI1